MPKPINRTLKSVLGVLLLAALHLACCKLIVALTLALSAAGGPQSGAAGWAISILVAATRVLYFPILSLSLYSRHWFPGDWILLPMAANSLLWAIGLFMLVRLLRRKNTAAARSQ